eukprot:m51a1_g90 putative zap1p (240) ;mRNA; f:285248-286160
MVAAANARTPRALTRCEWEGCGASFASAEALHDHLTLAHTSRPPWRCEWEGCRLSCRRWPYRSDLVRHLASHTPGHRPYACDKCPFRCSLSWRLSAHVRSRHSAAATAEEAAAVVLGTARDATGTSALMDAVDTWAASPRAPIAVPVAVEGDADERQVVAAPGALVSDVVELITRELLPQGSRVARIERVLEGGHKEAVDTSKYTCEFSSTFGGCPVFVVPSAAQKPESPVLHGHGQLQ